LFRTRAIWRTPTKFLMSCSEVEGDLRLEGVELCLYASKLRAYVVGDLLTKVTGADGAANQRAQ
jgi:hypothetical protein